MNQLNLVQFSPQLRDDELVFDFLVDLRLVLYLGPPLCESARRYGLVHVLEFGADRSNHRC